MELFFSSRALAVAEDLEQFFNHPDLIYREMLQVCDKRAELHKAKKVWQAMQQKNMQGDRFAKRLLSRLHPGAQRREIKPDWRVSTT